MNPQVLALHQDLHAKFVTALTSLHSTIAADSARLRAAQSDLLAGPPAIQDEMARLRAVRDVCTTVAGRYQETIRKAEGNLNELRKRGEVDVDEMLIAGSILHNQFSSVSPFLVLC